MQRGRQKGGSFGLRCYICVKENQKNTAMNMKELCEARYSCRHYKNTPIEKEKIEYIKECVRLAPSAKNMQPWKFLLVTASERLEKICACYGRERLSPAPAVVVCLQDRGSAWVREEDNKNHADIDVAIAIEHLCLAATEQGLATCWICNFEVQRLKDTVSLPEGYEPAALLPLGYPADEVTPKHRNDLSDIWE